MRVLFDTNVVLDVALARHPWVIHSEPVWRANENGIIDAYFSASTVTDVFYIVEREVGADLALVAVKACLETLEICTVDRLDLTAAAELPGNDFEDNLQIVCAQNAKLDAIITRNSKDFSQSSIAILTPEELLARLALQ